MDRHHDTNDLVCPECGEPAVMQAPSSWTPAWGPAPACSHLDGEPLCPVIGPHGYQPADLPAGVVDLDEPAMAGPDAEAPDSSFAELAADEQEFGL